MTTDNLQIPHEMPIMALPQAVLFPHSLLPLHIFEEKYREMLAWSLAHSRMFGIAQVLPEPDLLRDPSDIAEIMGVGMVRACVGKPDGTSDLILHGLKRFRVTSVAQAEPFRMVGIEEYPTVNFQSSKVPALGAAIREQYQALQEAGFRSPSQMESYLKTVLCPEMLGDLMASSFVEDPWLRQEILEEADLVARLELILTEMRGLTALGGG